MFLYQNWHEEDFVDDGSKLPFCLLEIGSMGVMLYYFYYYPSSSDSKQTTTPPGNDWPESRMYFTDIKRR